MADKDSGKEKECPAESPAPSPIPVITEEEKEMASVASTDFEAGQYAPCLEKLHALSKLRGSDVKVGHNLMVAKFYQSGCTRNDDLRKALGQVCTQAQVNLSGVDSLEDTDHAILFFNHAIILYHMRQHHEAIQILEKLFQIIEPLEENLAHKILLLLIETYLCTYQPEKALGILAYLEKLLFSTESSGNKGGSESSNKDNKDSNTEESNIDPEKYRPTLHLLKTRCYLQMKHVKVCKREIKTVMNSAGPCAVSLFLKSNFEYIRQNYRKAIKLLNSATPTADSLKTGQVIPVMYFNNLAIIHFYMGKYHLAAYYGRRALQENANAIAELPKRKGQSLNNRHIKTLGMNRRYELLYNVGIQLLHEGRPLAAFECLTEAIQVYPTNPRLWLRLAECCIAANALPQNSEAEGKSSLDSTRRGIVRNVIGSGPHRKVILSPGSSEYKYSDGQSAAFPAPTLEFASLCLSNALSLLPEETTPSTLSRITSRGSVGSDSSEVADTISNKQTSISNPTAPLGQSVKPTDIVCLRCSILASSSYVALSLGDNVHALEYARLLLEQTRLPGSLRFLGHLYAAEALINMDQIVEAIQHLAPDSVCDVSVVLPVLPEQGDKQGDKSEAGPGDIQESTEGHIAVSKHYPASVQVARATMLLNLACAHSLRSEWDKAKKCLKQMCSILPPSEIPEQALFLGIYIELQTGSHQMALHMVKKQQLIPYLKPSQSRPLPIGTMAAFNNASPSPQGVFSSGTASKAGRSKDPWQK
ncbi:CCR4-NOT transcription complex subunit 10-like isoform X2 [Acanthaster planci]|uniref:CCR4-NOT transcription complex subunit 10 n=1 Tax=Acanthaster planci TaxID=133434 RepID=A0A8B7XSY5_ACAPL|nr:CCR4-NOT transcription complex subunit 10-like isoform X2 [Acanthaster planci]